MVQKADIESTDKMEKEPKGIKKPLVSCDKYNQEEKKSLFGEEKES